MANITEIMEKEEAARLERLRQAERKHKTKERGTKRNKRLAIIVSSTICAVVTFAVMLTAVIIPNEKYNDAVELMNTGNVIEAYEALIALDGYKDSSEKANSIYDKYKIEKLKTAEVNAGDYIFFGTYEQDNNTSNGKESIEWLVLSREDSKLLVISKYALESGKPFVATFDDNASWDSSSLRDWLNNDFLELAFSENERESIATTEVLPHKNPDYNIFPGHISQDQVFLLSITEVNKYFNSDEARISKPTAKAKDAEIADADGNCWWWLRSTGSDQQRVACVWYDGTVSTDGVDVFIAALKGRGAVRPAMWIDLS